MISRTCPDCLLPATQTITDPSGVEVFACDEHLPLVLASRLDALGWIFQQIHGETLEPVSAIKPAATEPDLLVALETWAREMARSAKIMDKERLPDIAEGNRQLAHVLLRALSALRPVNPS